MLEIVNISVEDSFSLNYLQIKIVKWKDSVAKRGQDRNKVFPEV